MKISLKDLKNKVLLAILKLGYSKEDAKIICEVLMYSQMRGNNQGISTILGGGIPTISDIPGRYEGNGAGIFFMAIDPTLFVSKEQYIKECSEFLKNLKSAKPIENCEVLLLEERGDKLFEEIQKTGEIEVKNSFGVFRNF